MTSPKIIKRGVHQNPSTSRCTDNPGSAAPAHFSAENGHDAGNAFEPGFACSRTGCHQEARESWHGRMYCPNCFYGLQDRAYRIKKIRNKREHRFAAIIGWVLTVVVVMAGAFGICYYFYRIIMGGL